MMIDFIFVNDVYAGKKTAYTDEERSHILNAIKESGKEEVWLPVRAPYPGYYISNKGRAWSKKTNKLLKPHIDVHGYAKIRLCNSSSDNPRYGLHRLVVEAFYGLKPFEDAIIRHYPDQNPLNNNLENLQWSTIKQNNRDKVEGDNYFQEVKLTSDIVLQIKQDLEVIGLSKSEVCIKYDLVDTNLNSIINGKYWSDITGGSINVKNTNKKRLIQLDESDVLEICRLLLEEQKTITEVANQFHVSYPTINYIITGKRWGWLTNGGLDKSKLKIRGY